ncbi:MAG: hypothetical protein DME18_10655, partial [Verrucomicrobia bacterium]
MRFKFLFVPGLLLAALFKLMAQPVGVPLQIQPRGADFELSWPGRLLLPSGSTVYPLFQLQQCADMRHWESAGATLKGTGGSDPMRVSVSASQPRLFFRLSAQWETPAGIATGSGGDEVFGYGAAFAEELQRLGQISPEAFAARYGVTNAYWAGIDWDPATALYWDLFATDPAV